MLGLTVAMSFPEDFHSCCFTCQLFRFTHLLQSDFTTLEVLSTSWFSASFAALYAVSFLLMHAQALT
jgi:hypothetical protein